MRKKHTIDWKNLTSIIGFVGALGGGYYKLQEDNKQMVQEQIIIQKAEKARWQIDSLRIDRKFKELRWEMKDTLRMEIAKLKDELR
tara:strand:+ start:32 stop:289 length:258 start_codon:yes stop_codon:yes gene_type:complete